MTFEPRRPREWRDAYRIPGFTPSRAEPSRAERCGAVRCGAARCGAARRGTQTRIPEQLSSPCLAAYGQPEYTVALGFVKGLNTNSRVMRVAVTACVTRKTGD